MRQAIAAVFLLGLGGIAYGQSNPPPGSIAAALPGVWNQISDSGGQLAQSTVQYMPDGSFTGYMVAMNGLRALIWGRYRVEQNSANGANVTTEVTGWLPKKVCNQTGTCQAFNLPVTTSTDAFTMLDANTIRSGTITAQRGHIPDAARQPVPEMEQIVVQQAPQPAMPGPVLPAPIMPTLPQMPPPPNYHQANRDWLMGEFHNCSVNRTPGYPRYYGCTE